MLLKVGLVVSTIRVSLILILSGLLLDLPLFFTAIEFSMFDDNGPFWQYDSHWNSIV